MQNFWQSLSKPFFVLAPMDDVTDVVFREIIFSIGKPDVFFTEFTNTDGLCSEGREKTMQRLRFTPNQHPIVAQIWGNNPQHYFESAKLLKTLGFDGIDINFGCPDRSVIKTGSCGGLIRNPHLAKNIIQATKDGANGLPLSVKTRIGYNSIATEEWIGFMLEQNLSAIAVHLRTVLELSKVPARWNEMEKVIKLRDKIAPQTVIIGNGDITSQRKGKEKVKKYGCDGIMIGRGVFHNPWIFNKTDSKLRGEKEKIPLLIKHLELFDATWEINKHFEIMKKFYKMYISDIPNATDIRSKLMELHNAKDTVAFLKNILPTVIT